MLNTSFNKNFIYFVENIWKSFLFKKNIEDCYHNNVQSFHKNKSNIYWIKSDGKKTEKSQQKINKIRQNRFGQIPPGKINKFQ